MSGHAELPGPDGERRLRSESDADLQRLNHARGLPAGLQRDADLDGDRPLRQPRQLQPDDPGGGHHRAADYLSARQIYELDPTTTCKDFRLLFTQDPQNFPCYRLKASNPGQTYFNLYYIGTAGATVTFTITIPYPYVTQGAQPIHAYDNVTFSGVAPQR